MSIIWLACRSRGAAAASALLVGLAAWPWQAAAQGAAEPPQAARAAPKVLRYAMPVAETGFDPAQISDLYSSILTANIFEALLTYDPLAQPVKLVPQTALAMPEVSPDFRTYTFRIRPGIFFADDPAFKGQPRELTAQDYVYSIKRHYDPRWKSPSLYVLENLKLVGLEELRAKAIKENRPFPYDTEVDGVRALDRYTLRFSLGEPNPRLAGTLASPSTFGAVAREVVEAYGDRIMEHPVGTGAYRLAQWRRSSQIVLEANPRYHEDRYAAEPAAEDERGLAIAQRLKGRKLPMVDRVEVSIIEESQPRWLAFLNAEQDLLPGMPAEFIDLAVPKGQLAPHLAVKGIAMERRPGVDVTVTYFGMDHPVVGGYTAEKVALRRAIALAYDVGEEIRLIRRNQAVPAQSPIAPMTFGFDPAFRSEMSVFSRPRSKALLDMYGYVDRDGDGWRDLPDGRPLQLELATGSDLIARQFSELWKKNMDAIGVRIGFRIAKWPEQLKLARAGKLMMWSVGFSANDPDSDTFLAMGYGPGKGQSNLAGFELKAFDELYDRQRVLPDGEERFELITRAKKLLVAYMPYKAQTHRIGTDLWHPWVVGYRRHPFLLDWWRFVDIDPPP